MQIDDIKLFFRQHANITQQGSQNYKHSALFVVTQSPIKAIKQKELLRKKEMRERRINPQSKKKEINIQIIDPLPIQLKNYRDETAVKMSVQTSKASESLKKYVLEQQRNLRCLRLQKIATEQKLNTSRLKSLTLNVNQIEQQDKNSKQIHIPRIEDLFKNQSKEILIYQNTTLRDQLGKIIHKMDEGINKFKNMSFSYTKNEDELGRASKTYQYGLEEDYDKKTDNLLSKSKFLREMIYKEKREMNGRAPGEGNINKNANNMSFFLREIQKPKIKEDLRGVRTYSYSHGNRNIKLTPASILLFEMNKLNREKQKKEYQLTGLLKNSFQNRDTILRQKQMFYQGENPFNDLSPSKQFQLRKVMNKKLNHRLQISKEQVNKFIEYLFEIKNYHVILNQTILQILKEVRVALLRGKVMKMSDLQNILENKKSKDLRGYPNELIVKTLTQMMI